MGEVYPERGVIRFGAFEVDVRAGELRKQGVKIKLQEQPFQILHILLEHPGEMVTREELRKRIWPADTFVDFDHGLYNAIKRLREALGDTAETPRYIETLPKRGYRFIGTVNGAADAPRAVLAAPSTREKAELGARLPKSRILLTVAAGGVAILAIVLGLNLGGWRQRLLAKSAAPKIQSLAVLPLANLSGDPSQEYFADGLTEELITGLSKISALRVVSRTSVMRYKKAEKTMPEIARELGVDAIVEGSVRRWGDRVRVTVQLIYAPQDRNLWAQNYERDMQDVLALQSAVAAAIAEEIQVKATPQEQARLRSIRAVNPKAVDAYLAGRHHLHESIGQELLKSFETSSQEEFKKAIASFDLAIQEDPNFAAAYLGFFLALDGLQAPHLDLVPKAKAAVAKALVLDETNAEAHLAMGWILMRYEWNWSDAEKEFQRALELNPNYARAHNDYGEYLIAMGREAKGRRELELARRVDPGCDQNRDRDPLSCFDDIEQLRKYVEETKSVDPFLNGALAKSYEETGRHEEAIAQWQRTMTLMGYPELAETLARGYAKGGYKTALREWAKGLEEVSKQRYIVRIVMALIYLDLGDKDRAFAWLEKAYEEHNWLMVYLKSDRSWDPIRSDPRFKDLVRRVGLPP